MSNYVDEVLQLSKEDLYKLLEEDNEIDVDINLENLSNLNVETDTLLKAKFSLQSLSGKKSLRKIWLKVRLVTCTIYKENPKIGEKDLIDAVIVTLGISGNWAIALVALALKLGLDKVCAVYS